MTFSSRLWSLMFAGSLALGGCAVVPVDEYGYYDDDYGYYERDTVVSAQYIRNRQPSIHAASATPLFRIILEIIVTQDPR